MQQQKNCTQLFIKVLVTNRGIYVRSEKDYLPCGCWLSNGRLSWNYLPCPPRGGAGRIRGFLATFDCQQCESDTRFVSYFKPTSSLKWRNLKIWRSMSYVLSASEWSYTVTIRIIVALLNGPMCSWFFSLRWLRLFCNYCEVKLWITVCLCVQVCTCNV